LLYNSCSLQLGTSEGTCKLCSINIRLVYDVHAVGKGSVAGEICGNINPSKKTAKLGKYNNKILLCESYGLGLHEKCC